MSARSGLRMFQPCCLGHVRRLAEVAVKLVEAVKLRLVGPVHGGGVGIVEAALVQVPQGVEIRRRHEGVVNGMERLPGGIRGTGHGERGPMPGLPAGGDGPHVVGVDRVGGRLDPLPQAAGDPLLDGQERHHVEKLVDLQVRQMIFDLEDRRRFRREPVVAGSLAAAVPPLRQTDDGVRPAGAGQEQATDRLRHVALQVMGVVGQHEPEQEVLQRGVLFLVAEGRFDHLPERNVEVELLDLAPHGGRIVEVDLAPGLGPGVEDRPHEVEQFRLVGLGDHGDHLAVQVGGGVIRGDQILDLLEPFLGVEELAAVGNMGSQVLIHQPQLLQQDAGPVRPEAAAVEPDVEQPVVFVVGFLGRGVEQELAVGFVPLQADFGFERPDLIEPQRGHAFEHDERQRVLELPVGIVPEDDPLPFLVEEAFQGRVDLVQVAHSSSFPPVIGLDLGQQVAELAVVHLHAVVEVEADLLVGSVLQLFLEGEQFGLLLLEVVLLLLELLAVTGAGRLGLVAFELFDAGGDLALERDDVLGAHPGQRAFVVAVQVDEALEGPLLAAGEQPVDWPLLVHRQVVLVEPGGEVAADRVPWLFVAGRAEAVGDELQVLFQVFLRPCHADELHDAVGGVVPDAPIGFEQRNDAVVVGAKGLVLAGIEAHVAAVGVDQPWLVEAVAAHHAADGVGEQPLDVLFTVGAVECDLVVGNFGVKVHLAGHSTSMKSRLFSSSSSFIRANRATASASEAACKELAAVGLDAILNDR